MQLPKTQIYIVFILALLPCLTGHSSPVIGREHMRASVYTERGTDKLFKEKDYEGAIADFGIALQIAPDYPYAYHFRGLANVNLGVLALDQGKAEKAQHHFRNAREGYNQAISLYQAIAVDEAVALDPQTAYAYDNRGGANGYLGILEMIRGNVKQAQHHYQSAIADCDKAVALDPENPQFYINRSWARVHLGESEVTSGNIQEAQRLYPLAITDCDKAVALTKHPEVYSYCADAKLKFGEFKTLTGDVTQAEQHYRSAIEDCRQAISLNPKLATAFYTQGRAKAALGNYTGAIADFDTAITIKADYALADYARGHAKRALGQDTAAETDFQKAKALNPDVEKLYRFGKGAKK